MNINIIKPLMRRSPLLKKIVHGLGGGFNTGSAPLWQSIWASGAIAPAAPIEGQPAFQKILFATCTGGHPVATEIETLLAASLALRGNDVHVVLCDGTLPACLMCEIASCWSVKRFAARGLGRSTCRQCFNYGYQRFHAARIAVHFLGDFIDVEDRRTTDHFVATTPVEQIAGFRYKDMAVGEHAMAGALRFFAKGSLADEPLGGPVLKRYFAASLLTTLATNKLQQQFAFTVSVFHHGIYIPHGIVGEVLRKTECRVVNWNVGYRKGTFIFSHNDTYHHSMMTEPTGNWESIPWNQELEDRTVSYIETRAKGVNDWHAFLKKPSSDLSRLALDPVKPAIGLLTNVCWDAQLHYPANIFKDMLEWIFLTISYFSTRPELQLIIRVHPAEITAGVPSRHLVTSEIKKQFPALPSNIFVVPPESRLNTYTLMKMCNSAIIYGTKTGVELTSLGIPVIVAGEAWIRNKGITIDPDTKEAYFRVLDQLPFSGPISTQQTRRARMYAYHFFFRRMLPIEVLRPVSGYPPFKIELPSLKDLYPGKHSGLDQICNGILTGAEFSYTEDRTSGSRR
jgi:hypothetical protein